MYIKNSVLPQANIYTSKIIFDKLEDRNQKRLAQMIKRKNILLSKNKRDNKIKKDKSSEQMITPSTQDISTFINNNATNNNILDLSKSSIKEENYYNKILSSSKPITMKRFLSSFKFHNKNTTDINEFNIIDEDLYEKEINISNLNDNDTFIDNYKDEEKNKHKNNNIIIINNKNNNNNNKNNINIYNDNDIKEKNNIHQRNKYAIEFLSSNLYSFVEFKNKLVTKAKYNKNYFTSSYSQALFLDNNISDNKVYGQEKTEKTYEVNDIIKEENEPYSPKENNKLYLRQSTNMISIKKKTTIKDPIKLNNNKLTNKTFCKTVENYINNKRNLIKGYNFNKNVLINNCKLKISKTKLSMEIKNKRKINENKESKKTLNINHNNKDKNIVISPKLVKIKTFLDDIHNKKENSKKGHKEKSKKIKKQ